MNIKHKDTKSYFTTIVLRHKENRRFFKNLVPYKQDIQD